MKLNVLPNVFFNQLEQKMSRINNSINHTTTKPLSSTNVGSTFSKQKLSIKANQIIEVNFCYTAWISMCLGFLFIWSSVISLIFIANKVDEGKFMQKPLEIFLEQEHIGRIMFSVGQEMLFTVDSLVSIQLNLSNPQELSQSVNFTWDLTDDDIDDVKTQLENPTNDLINIISSIETKLELIRSNISLATDHPLTIIDSYKLIFDISEMYSVEKNFYTPSMKHDNQWHLIKTFTEIQHAPYSLFIKGMNRRFIELAYGTIYHIGPELFNRTNLETEVSNYFYYFYSSHELIENSFAWDSRIYHRYMELLRNKQNRILQTSSNVNSLTGREYTRFVTDVVAYLLRAKDILNVGLKEVLLEISSKNPTIFYATISCIYLIVLILCSTFFVLFIRNAKIKHEISWLPTTATISQSDDHQPIFRSNANLNHPFMDFIPSTPNMINSISSRVGVYEQMPITI